MSNSLEIPNKIRIKARLSTHIIKLITQYSIDEQRFIRGCGVSQEKAKYFWEGMVSQLSLEELAIILATLDINYRGE